MGLFKKLGQALTKTKNSFKEKIDYIFTKSELTEDFYDELEEILISSDVGVEASIELTSMLRKKAREERVKFAEDAKELFKEVLIEALTFDASGNPLRVDIEYPAIITIVGVNGVGKTTTIGKLANYFKEQGKDVTLVAGDTYRAAASDQLTQWATRNKVKIVKHNEGADAGAVVYDGIASAKAKNTDVLIIDTAGRLHTKVNLMEELAKINRIITRENTYGARAYTFIVLDGTTGQNAVSQIKHFSEFVDIDGIVLTKLDGTAKGGVVLAISKEYNLPVVFVGVGEGIDDLELFDAKEFVDNIF